MGYVLRGVCALFGPTSLCRSIPDVYVSRGDEIRVFHRSLASQNCMSLLGVGSVPATNMRQNQSQVGGRTPTTNSPHQGTPGQHWMSARPMSAHFLHDLHPCFAGFGGFAPVLREGHAALGGSRGLAFLYKGTALPRWEVPTSTGMFLGVRDHA